jgi:hypothetical protein
VLSDRFKEPAVIELQPYGLTVVERSGNEVTHRYRQGRGLRQRLQARQRYRMLRYKNAYRVLAAVENQAKAVICLASRGHLE